MIDDPLIHAIDRLEQAVIQLERRLPGMVASTPVPPPDAGADEALQARYDQLEERHSALRTRTSAAVERLTRLLDTGKG